ncbi:MAG: hypothetical protein LBC74_00845 [Planctomycetaceae bacterium]|nr:hypothetical protein [Planctomycetaceae bacterium]
MSSMFLCLFGVLLITSVLLITAIKDVNQITGHVENMSLKRRENKEPYILTYNVVVKNDHTFRIRLCGGQLNWCGAGGRYHAKMEFPLYLDAKQQTKITIEVSPNSETIPETELILYADGGELGGLTPIKVRLPVMSTVSL